VQSTKCQRGHLEDDPFWNAKPVKADQCISDVFGSPHVEDEPGCSILNRLDLFYPSNVNYKTDNVAQTSQYSLHLIF